MSERKVTILKALAHPTRICIAEMLAEEEFCACEIAERFSWDRTTISKHLTLMREVGILEDRRDGVNIYYRLKMRCLLSALKCIDQALEEGDYNERLGKSTNG